MSITLITRNVRLSFDKNLFDASEPKVGKKFGKRNCNGIIGSDSQIYRMVGGQKKLITFDELGDVVTDALKEKFNGNVPAKFEDWAFRKNTEMVSSKTGERHSGYEDDNGVYVAPSRMEDQGYPLFLRRDGSVLNPDGEFSEKSMAEAQALFYAGCYVTLKITVGAYETTEKNVTKRGVTTYLEAVQFLSKGEPFGRGAASAEGLEAEPEELEDDI
jgi:hypothetical protein